MKRKRPCLFIFVPSAWLCAVLAMGMFAGGCLFSPDRSRQITLEPQSRKIEYHYDFDQAYAAPSTGGGYDLVLTSGLELNSGPTFPRVHPAAIPSTSQMLHIHLSWIPSSGAKIDHPAAANSTIRWQIFHGEPSTTPSRALYTGTGFVALKLGGDQSEFDIRGVALKLHGLQGDMRDPLGPSRVSGVIMAQNNEPVVRELLRKLETDMKPATRPVP